MVVTRDHILPLPQNCFVTRCVQLATAVVIMGLAAYGITYLSFDAIDLTLFSALITIIIAVYVIVASTGLPAAYNYWAILGLDIFAVVFWVISFSYLAYEVASVRVVTYHYSGCAYVYNGVCYKHKRGLDIAKRATTDVYTYRNAMAAAAGLGGLEFVLFVKTLVFTSIYLHRHRKAGKHCTPYDPDAPVAVQQPAPVQQAQPIYQPQQPVQQVYQQQVPQPVYQQAPVQPQQVYQQPQPQPMYQPQQQQPQTYQPQATYQPTGQ